MSWSATGNGGFAAAESKLTVNIGGAAAQMTWASGGFVTGNLVLSSAVALSEVEFVNPIDLAGSVRTIQVDVNASSNSDLATLSGLVSGGAGSGLTKIGGGILRLLQENTYSGDTNINGGTVRAVTIGNSASTSSNFGVGAGKINIGNAGTQGTLAYVGGGETTNRLVEIGGSTANVILESSGSGPLVLTNVVNASTGTGGKTFFLRGDLNASNEITSNLTNNTSGGTLNVTKDDNGTWILSGANTFTGNMTVSSGPMGFRTDGTLASGPFGVGTLILSNGSLFALDGDRSLAQSVRLSANADNAFIGVNSITLTDTFTNTGGDTRIINSLPAGKFLTVTQPTFTGQETATARVLDFRGGGDTIFNTSITNTSGGATISLLYRGYGSLTLGGSNGASTYSGNTTVTSGTLRVGSADAVPNGTGRAI